MAEHIIDQLNRPIHDLRISVTDRCQFRCPYCLPAEHVDVMRQHSKPENHLSFAEITAITRAFAACGVEKIRLTGGEPLLRKNLHELVRSIKAIKGIREVALTTNGALLDKQLAALVDAGLDRITISMDALDQDLYEVMTGSQVQVRDILAVIDRCDHSALKKVKVNCVIQKGQNEHQVIPMLEAFRGSGVEVRFIEYMDVGNINGWEANQVLFSQDILEQIAERWPHQPLPPKHPGEVANRHQFTDGQGSFGLISSISEPFCLDCNRARLSAQGEVFTCLFSQQGHPVRSLTEQPELLLHEVRRIWQQREDKYSMERSTKPLSKANKIEMFVIGG